MSAVSACAFHQRLQGHQRRCRRPGACLLPDIFWIAGGKAKEGGIESLRPHFPRIRKAYLIGEAADDFARTLDGMRLTKSPTRWKTQLLAQMQMPRAHPCNAPVVLLSPACASFDQFRDFEQRGDVFRTLVAQLATHLQDAAS